MRRPTVDKPNYDTDSDENNKDTYCKEITNKTYLINERNEEDDELSSKEKN